MRLQTKLTTATALAVACSVLLGCGREHRSLRSETLADFPWVRQCAGPPPGYQVVTNSKGQYGLSFGIEGEVLYGSTANTRQGAINFGWQYVMYEANAKALPKPEPEVWKPEAP